MDPNVAGIPATMTATRGEKGFGNQAEVPFSVVDKATDVLPAHFHVVPSSVHSGLRKCSTILWSRKVKHLNCVYLCG